MTPHTRVVVSCFFRNDLFVRQTIERGAKFRDEVDIARVEAGIRAEMSQHWVPYSETRGELQFRVATREV